MIETVAPCKKLVIALPSYAGKPMIGTRRSLDKAVRRAAKDGVELVAVITISGQCYLDVARNLLVRMFRDTAGTDMLFVDDDVAFEEDAIARICAATRPIVAGIYPKKTTPIQWPIDGAGPVGPDGLAECEMAPTGFMRINRAVFELMAPECEAFGWEGKTLVAFFQTLIKDGRYWGEDVHFCRTWRQMGGKLHAIADMNFTHTDKEGHDFAGNWATWLMQQAREAA